MPKTTTDNRLELKPVNFGPQQSTLGRGCRCGRPPTCQDCSRLLARSLAIRCPACLRGQSPLAEMVFATHAPSTWATFLVPV
jgi:hypothetical protein